MSTTLEPCPFCGGKAEQHQGLVRSGYGEYERTDTYHSVKCKECGASSKRFDQKHLADFTKYTVHDFRGNPILRAKVEDEYDAYCELLKQISVNAWNRRAVKAGGRA